MPLPRFLRFSNRDVITDIAKQFMDLLKVPVTRTYLTNALEEHPDYPSLLCMSDVLTNLGVENVTIKTTIENLPELPFPFVGQVKNNHTNKESLFIIAAMNDQMLSVYNAEAYRWQHVSIVDFEKQWTGIAFLVSVENAMGDKDYPAHRRQEKRLALARVAAFAVLPLLIITGCAFALINEGIAILSPVLFTLFTLAGCILSALLIAYELDQHNPFLQQICSAGKKINCGAVLNTKAAKIAGISWSAIGFTYFTGSLLTLLFTGITNSEAFFIVSWLNMAALPYVFFSVYYQWRVAKQWCVLCLGVQGILLLQFVTAFMGNGYTAAEVSSLTAWPVINKVLAAYLLPFIIVSLLLPAYGSAKESKRNKNELQRLKHNTRIFEALIAKQKAVTESPEGLGITLGNPNGSYKLIKVCNPYCGPCANAHKPIEELLDNNPDIQLQIIFTATNAVDDKRTPPVKHLLALAEKQNEPLIRQALDDWYLAEQKNYETFAGKYPLNGELNKQNEKVEAMWQWCNKTQITFTPTFFVNGYQLPEMYSVNDLKYFLLV